jgi:serine/threonine protein kinase
MSIAKLSKKWKGRVLLGRYVVEGQLGHGSFGHVFQVVDKVTKQRYAAKVSKDELLHEFQLSRFLKDMEVFPRSHHIGREEVNGESQSVLIMDLMSGETLESIFKQCHYTFHVHTVFTLAIRLLDVLEALHGRGIVFRDLKPDNMIMDGSTLKLVDLGLARPFIHFGTDTHLPSRRVKFSGTLRYASRHVHEGENASRRDDLESLGYILLHWYRGELPWQNKFAEDTFIERVKKIGQMKAQPLESLFMDAPLVLLRYMQYARELDYLATPDYGALRQIFEQALAQAEVRPVLSGSKPYHSWTRRGFSEVQEVKQAKEVKEAKEVAAVDPLSMTVEELNGLPPYQLAQALPRLSREVVQSLSDDALNCLPDFVMTAMPEHVIHHLPVLLVSNVDTGILGKRKAPLSDESNAKKKKPT